MHAGDQRYIVSIGRGGEKVIATGLVGVANYLRQGGVRSLSVGSTGHLFESPEADVYLSRAKVTETGLVYYEGQMIHGDISQINAMLGEQATPNDITQSSRESER